MDADRAGIRANIGRQSEDRALSHLQEAGLTLIERNVHCRSGEIDLVMREGSTIVFVEVRMRRNSRFGSAAESIDSGKLRRVRVAAELWLRRSGNGTAPTRIDVVALDGTDSGTARITWVRGIDAWDRS